MTDTPYWDRDDIQIVRLLAEIAAVGLAPDQVKRLATSMDLEEEDVRGIMLRAEEIFQAIKEQLDHADTDCVFCGKALKELAMAGVWIESCRYCPATVPVSVGDEPICYECWKQRVPLWRQKAAEMYVRLLDFLANQLR